MYIHLHGHSHYSLLDAIGHPADIVAKAKELGMSSIALTDYNGMYGAIEFYQACLKKEIKPIIGVELGLVHDRLIKTKTEQIGNIVLLALDYEGYTNLLQLVSHANLESFYLKARIDFDLLRQHHAGLICFMGGENSYLGQMIIRDESTGKIQETITLLRDIFGNNNVYLELIAQNESHSKDLHKVNHAIRNLASDLSCPLLCSTNYHYVTPESKEVLEVAFAIKDSNLIYDHNRRKVLGDYHITSEEEVREVMINKNGYDTTFMEEILTNNLVLADRIHLEIPLGKTLFPKYTPPEDITELYTKLQDQLIEKR